MTLQLNNATNNVRIDYAPGASNNRTVELPDANGTVVLTEATNSDDVTITGDLTVSQNVIVGNPDLSSDTVSGVRILDDGTITCQRQDTAGNSTVFTALQGTDSNITLRANGQATFAGNIQLQNQLQFTNTGDNILRFINGNAKFIRYRVSNDVIQVVNQSNGVNLENGGTSWVSNSQRSLKTALVPIDNAVEKIKTLSTVTGRYKVDDESTSRAFLIADEVQAVLPEAVYGEGTEENPLRLAYSEVIPLLTATLKESIARIEALEAEVQALKGGAS